MWREDLKNLIDESFRPVFQSLDRLEREHGEDFRLVFRFSSKEPLRAAIGLTARVIDLIPRRAGTRASDDWLVSSLLTRYLFEVTANYGVLTNSAPEVRNLRQQQWFDLRHMAVYEDGIYAVPLKLMSERAVHRIKKNGEKPTPLPEQEYIAEEHGIRVDAHGFLFEDPWALTMANKVALLPLRDRDRFLAQWKIYCHIAHASAFSLWPTWIDPTPHEDALQCLTVMLNLAGAYSGHEAHAHDFMSEAFQILCARAR